jgi:hypothetical protein
MESSWEFDDELSSSIKCWDNVEWLHKWWPLEYCSVSYLVIIVKKLN